VIAQSSCEVEYIVASLGVCEAVWLSNQIMEELSEVKSESSQQSKWTIYQHV
jgi:hypothetical protein